MKKYWGLFHVFSAGVMFTFVILPGNLEFELFFLTLNIVLAIWYLKGEK